MRRRAVFDTNLYLNFLLSPDPAGTAVGFALEAASQRLFELLLPEDVVTELRAVVARRADLKARISQDNVNVLLHRLLKFVTLIPAFTDEPPQVSRDPGDDYLIVLAVLNAADYIVTRDRDLLDLGEVAGVRIVNPVAFLDLLRSADE